MVLYMYTAPGQEQTIAWGQTFYVKKESPYHFAHSLQV